MKIGTFYLHQVPRPWDAGSEHRYFKSALDEVELQDRLGFDHFWVAEHHFLEEYSHSSAPEIFLAACTQRTRQIRLGQGIVQLPPLINHPARVAERIATLDLISDGRIEFGTGEGACPYELNGFHVTLEEKHAMWLEGLQSVTRMMVEEPFGGFDGKYVKIPPRNIVPKPLQKPHPPLWLACSRHETILLAARLGLGALCFAFVSPDEAAQWVRDYRATLASECRPIGRAVNPQLAVLYPFVCERDESEAQRLSLDHHGFFTYGLDHYWKAAGHQPGATNLWNGYVTRTSDPDLPLGKTACVGTPAQVRELLRGFEASGVDEIIFMARSGKMSHERVCSSLELFGREVLPEFKERDARHDAATATLADETYARAMERGDDATA
jgi:alkanesulfonate monooxygenase SsuD/methylene tetrahydromethanopterin reductase-like flavin-dependent oxidoreductase (luciferase family)